MSSGSFRGEPSDREREMADVILMLIRDNRDDLRELTRAVAGLTSAVSAHNARLETVESMQRADGHVDVTLARLEARVASELGSRPTYKQFIAAMGGAVMLSTAIATVVIAIIGVSS